MAHISRLASLSRLRPFVHASAASSPRQRLFTRPLQAVPVPPARLSPCVVCACTQMAALLLPCRLRAGWCGNRRGECGGNDGRGWRRRVERRRVVALVLRSAKLMVLGGKDGASGICMCFLHQHDKRQDLPSRTIFRQKQLVLIFLLPSITLTLLRVSLDFFLVSSTACHLVVT